MSLAGPLPRGIRQGGWTRRYQIDPEQVLPNAQEIAVTEGDIAADRDVGTVGRAEIGHVKVAVAPSSRMETWRRDMKGSSVKTMSPDSRPMIVSSRCK